MTYPYISMMGFLLSWAKDELKIRQARTKRRTFRMLIVLNKYTKWKRTFNKIQAQILQIKMLFRKFARDRSTLR
jgi:hypothetical protein